MRTSKMGVRRPAKLRRVWAASGSIGAYAEKDAQVVMGALHVFWGLEQLVVDWATGRVGYGAPKAINWFVEAEDLAAFDAERREILGMRDRVRMP